MAEIRSFKSVYYNKNRAGQLGRLITPPYDVISPEEQERFYRESPHNIIRLVLGKQASSDSESDNRYTRASAFLAEWLREGILVRDQSECLTVYQMEFQRPDGGKASLDGIVAVVKVDDYGQGKVLPHEKTYKGPKVDQLNLMRACKANLTPIHGLFDDASDSVIHEYSRFTEQPPDQVIQDGDGTIHRTWKIFDSEVISRIKGLLSPKSIFIADGHHRYETALAYRRELEESGQAQPGGPQDYVMMYLTSMSHPGLTILPAHRMVKGLSEVDFSKIAGSLEPYFEIDQLAFSPENRDSVSQQLVERIRSYSEIGGKFGMVLAGENCYRLLRLKDFSSIDRLMGPDIPSTLRGLDVTILREIIMTLGLGIQRDNSEGLIEYTPLVSEALEKALKGEVQISFILNPTRVDQMSAAAKLGHKLPHKSTYFFPKLSSGLVINVFG